MSLLSVRTLNLSYDGKAILRDVSFDADRGEFIAVLGKNGAGKTSLFRCILNMQDDYCGEILLDDRNVRSLKRRESAKEIAYIPQLHKAIFAYNASDIVLMGTAADVSVFKRPTVRQETEAEAAMRMVGISDLANRQYNTLSGGEQQLVLIARALAQKSRLLIMDEPTSSLDYGNRIRILSLCRKLCNEGYTILASLHDPYMAASYADKILAIAESNIKAFDYPEAVINEKFISELYDL